ncbi:MAG: 4'-phosphopantetheinyl transferase superfamily protein [Lachnospiraceae bacterium]|nr:4'-phosphopantetheinyl transferase superfamily protein [Lachnospiraceae bacterium]
MIYIQKVDEITAQSRKRNEILHQCAHDLLWSAVKEEYPEMADKLTMRRQEHGKPYFVEKSQQGEEYSSEIQFNLSHSGSYVVCIVGDSPMGIDLEKLRPYNEKVAKKILHQREWAVLETSRQKERDFIRFWTLKEAYGKYTGKGLGEDMKSIFFAWDIEGKICCSDKEVFAFQWFVEGEYYLSVCVSKTAGDMKTLTNFRRSDKIYTC